jgi:hypothetical protein
MSQLTLTTGEATQSARHRTTRWAPGPRGLGRLATTAQRFRLDLAAGHRVSPEPLVTLRPRGGLPMTLTPL